MRQYPHFIIIVILINCHSLIINKKLNPSKVEIAIDCGSQNQYSANTGIQFQKDQGFSENTKIANYGQNFEASGATIKFTDDQALFMTERHADTSFTYEIPVKKTGHYVLMLFFSEMHFNAKDKRVFNIKFGDKIVAENIDIYKEVGKNAAYEKYIEFELTSSFQVKFKDEVCFGAYNVLNNKLTVEFSQIKNKDNPKGNWKVLIQNNQNISYQKDTDINEIPKRRKDWERNAQNEKRRKEEEQQRMQDLMLKKKEKKIVRNDLLEDEAEVEDIDGPPSSSGKQFTHYFKLIGIFGVIILIFQLFFKSDNIQLLKKKHK